MKTTKRIMEIQLTEDPLTNIYIMVPLLNDKAREAISYLMYGCCLGEELSKSKYKLEENK